ncbi:unnamed protein product [Phytomonas sp. EM1]|nr:unnamed protein product [Phytomonas sp. EM1]|eukprot:CCW63917.1 unnamed protein product [Phytomonas sp. isolate EM1]
MPPCGVSSKDGAVSEERPYTIKLPQLVPPQPGLEVLESNIAVPRALRGEALLGTKATDSRSDVLSGTTSSGGAVSHDRNSPLEGLNSPSRLQRRSEENQQDNSFYPNDSKVVNGVVSLQYMDDPWYDYRSNMPQSAANVQEAGSGGSFSCDSAKLTPLQMRNRCGYYSSVLQLNEEASLTGSELGEGFNNPGNKLRTKAALNRSSLKNTEFCFPRFNRLLFTRSAKIYTPVETLKQTLAELELPYIPELDHRVLSADFNTYKLAEVHGTYVYVIVAMNVLLSYEFVSRFEFSVHKLLNFVKEAFTFFSPGNPLHHPVHAADIIAAVHQWLSQPTVGANLSDEEMLPFLFASIVMRIGHSGWSNHSLAREKHPYSALCCYTAPQQGATMSLTLALLEKPENHFFPSTGDGVDNVEPDTPVMNGDPDCRRPSTLAQTHMWTSEKEDTFYNMVYELIMATDERSYYNIQRSLEQIDQDHYITHGCICSEADGSSEPTTPTVPLATNPLPKRLNKNCKRCCAYISDAHLPTVMSAVLHILNYSYVFRPYEVFLSGNFSFSASMYRQSDLRVEETQRRRQKQQSRQQAEGKEEQGMGDPTSDSRQMLMPDFTNEVRDLPLHRGSSSSGSSGATWRGASVSMKNEGEAALLKAPQRWREDATPTSTVSPLLQQSTLAGTTPTVPRPNPPLSHRASQRLSQSVPQPSSQSLSQRLSQPSSQPRSQRLSRLMSQPTGDLSAILAASSVENFADGEMTSSVGDLLPGRSLQRKGRDILLLAFEEIHYPMVQTIQPYVPADWVKKSHLNFTRFLTELPSEEEYDLIVERTLQLCGSSKFNDPSEATARDDGKPSPLQRLIQAVEEIEIAKYIPFHIIEIALRPHGTTDVESSTLPSMSREVEVRVLKEIMRSSIEFLALNGASV